MTSLVGFAPKGLVLGVQIKLRINYKISILGNIIITPYFFFNSYSLIWCTYYTIRLDFYLKNQLFEDTVANARG